jgi:Resolvase, N terminal domain
MAPQAVTCLPKLLEEIHRVFAERLILKKGKLCTVCAHRERAAIDLALTRGAVRESQHGRTTVENQIRELRQVARRRGWDVVEVYSDAGISGAKGRNGRPGLDSILKDSEKRPFSSATV